MDLNLRGKTAIVTRGGSGIGKALSFLLAEENAGGKRRRILTRLDIAALPYSEPVGQCHFRLD
jgi:NAD(P)-dependent dehydrogenase (short-subunit alcohol dehydrogenase family)